MAIVKEIDNWLSKKLLSILQHIHNKQYKIEFILRILLIM